MDANKDFMGVYINPGRSGFAEVNNSEYVDKTMLIELINETQEKQINSPVSAGRAGLGSSACLKNKNLIYNKRGEMNAA